MHRAAAELPGEKTFCLANVDDAADCFASVEARKGSVSADAPESQHMAQHRCSSRGIIEHQSDAMKAADRMFRRNIAGTPRRLALRFCCANKSETHAVRIVER